MSWLGWFVLSSFLLGANARLFCVEEVKLTVTAELVGIVPPKVGTVQSTHDVTNGEHIHSVKQKICSRYGLNGKDFYLSYENTRLKGECAVCDYGMQKETKVFLFNSTGGAKPEEGPCPKKYDPVMNKLFWTFWDGPGTSNKRLLRCGPHAETLPNGLQPQCDPESAFYCCSQYGHCGNTKEHCHGPKECVNSREGKYYIRNGANGTAATEPTRVTKATMGSKHLTMEDFEAKLSELEDVQAKATNSTASIEQRLAILEAKMQKMDTRLERFENDKRGK